MFSWRIYAHRSIECSFRLCIDKNTFKLLVKGGANVDALDEMSRNELDAGGP